MPRPPPSLPLLAPPPPPLGRRDPREWQHEDPLNPTNNDDDAATANLAAILLLRELCSAACGRRAARERRAAAVAARAVARRSPYGGTLGRGACSPTDPNAALVVWAEAAMLRRARSRYLDVAAAPVAAAPGGATTTAHAPPRSTIAARFSADGALLACSHGDHALRVWCASTGRPLCVLQGHARTPWCVAWHPHRGDTLASGSLDGAVLVWRLEGALGEGGAAPAWLGRDPAAAEAAAAAAAAAAASARLRRRSSGEEAGGRRRSSSSSPSSPSPSSPSLPPPQQQLLPPPPPLRPRLIARHDFRRPVASLSFSPSGAVLAVQAGRRMFTWRYEAEAPWAGGTGALSARPPAAAVSAAAAAAATAPVEIYRARNTLRMVAPHPVAAGVPLLVTAEAMAPPGGGGGGGTTATAATAAAAAAARRLGGARGGGAGGGLGGGGAAAAGPVGGAEAGVFSAGGGGGATTNNNSAPGVTLQDLPRALSPELSAYLCADGRRGRRGPAARRRTLAVASSIASRAVAADENAGDSTAEAERPRNEAVAAALALLRARLAEAEAAGGNNPAAGLAAAAAPSGGGVPPYLLGELIAAASRALERATAAEAAAEAAAPEGGDGTERHAAAEGAGGPPAPPADERAAAPAPPQPAPADRRGDPSRVMRDQAWFSRMRQWTARRGEEQLREEEREAAAQVAAAAGGEDAPTVPATGAPPPATDNEDNAPLERAPSAAGPGLVAALPPSTRTFSPEWLLPSPAPAAAAAATPQAPPPPPPPATAAAPAPRLPFFFPRLSDVLPLRDTDDSPISATGETPGYRRYWAADEGGEDRAVHLGGAGPSSSLADGGGGGAAAAAAAVASAAAPALAAAAEAFRATALAACMGSQALPCLATLRLWRWEDGTYELDASPPPAAAAEGGAGGAADAASAAAPARRAAPATLRPPRLLRIPCVVLCSEISASISPCGRMLAVVVACRPREEEEEEEEERERAAAALPASAAAAAGEAAQEQQQQQQEEVEDDDPWFPRPQTGGLEHAQYELRVYSIETTPSDRDRFVAPTAAATARAGENGDAATPAAPAADPPNLVRRPAALGRLLRARPIRAGHCLTTVQYSPTGAHIMIAYGRRHISLCSLSAAGGGGGGGGGGNGGAFGAGGSLSDFFGPNPPEVVPVHSVMEFYRADDLSITRVLPSLSDEVNAATWRGGGGAGAGVWGGGGAAAPPAVAYGTKEGRVRLIELGSG